jgi:hypothetical protein
VRSAVVRHHSAGSFGLTPVRIGRRGRELLDSIHRFLAKDRGVASDVCLAQPFNVGYASIERLNKLAKRMHDHVTIRHGAPFS